MEKTELFLEKSEICAIIKAQKIMIKEMYKMIGFVKDVNILSSWRAQSKTYGKIENRKSHAFLFKISGVTEYHFGDEVITLTEGNVLYIPECASYEYTATEGLYTSINFSASVEFPTPTLYTAEAFYKTAYIHESFSALWRFGSLPDRHACFSVFYDFLSYIARIEHAEVLKKNKTHLIEPAVEYLKTHLFDCNLKIERLARLCCISDTYFRKLFVSRFHVTPQEYVISKRISHAKAIMEGGDFDSISAVASLVGYKDPLYFSKAFKKMYGISPSDIIQQ